MTAPENITLQYRKGAAIGFAVVLDGRWYALTPGGARREMPEPAKWRIAHPHP